MLGQQSWSSEGCQSTRTPRHAQSLLQMASVRRSQELSGSECSPCTIWLSLFHRHLQTPSSWFWFQHRRDVIHKIAFSGHSQHSHSFTQLPLCFPKAHTRHFSYSCFHTCVSQNAPVHTAWFSIMAALCLHQLPYREIRSKRKLERPVRPNDEEQAMKRRSVVKVSFNFFKCSLVISS